MGIRSLGMDQYLPHLLWIDDQEKQLANLLAEWVQIHSGSYNLEGLEMMLEILKQSFSTLEGEIEEIPLPPKKECSQEGMVIETPIGKALKVSKHPDAEIQLLLGGHMDIAFPREAKLPPVQFTGNDTLTGRGAADMKGGLIVMLTALQALEKSSFSGKVGWQVLITPDEEIGSPGSRYLWIDSAKKKKLALIFEPSFPDGSLVSGRKGSANFTLVVKGKAAHVGREFSLGQNALVSCARFALAAESLSDMGKDLTVNIGYIKGGGLVNIVPDRALLRLNIRGWTDEELKATKEKLQQIARIESHGEDLRTILFQDSDRPPKVFDKKTRNIFEALKHSASCLGIDLNWKTSGGVCDGNLVAGQGVATIDTLGVVGGSLHTDEEYVILSTLTERSKLAARFLMQIGAGEIRI